MSDPYVGEIAMLPFSYAPQGWALCNGGSLRIQENQALFTLIGTSFGGDGVTTFRLPNLANRMIGGAGQGPALTPRNNGDAYGEENVTLLAGQMPAHTHGETASLGRTAPRTASPTGTSALGAYVGPAPYATTTANTTLNPAALTTAGGNQPHTNIQPVLAMLPCIALNGLYPQFS